MGIEIQGRRSYTEKDLILKIDKLEEKLDEIQNTIRQLYDMNNKTKPSERRYVHGIKGIATVFGCSVSTANRIKASGVIDEAIIQRGRRIIVDEEKALELFNAPNDGRRRRG